MDQALGPGPTLTPVLSGRSSTAGPSRRTWYPPNPCSTNPSGLTGAVPDGVRSVEQARERIHAQVAAAGDLPRRAPTDTRPRQLARQSCRRPLSA
jgi:hypothetical protein